MKTWYVEAVSESGDDYGVLEEFDHEPSEEDLKAITHESVIGSDGWSDDPKDWRSKRPGPGYNGSWLHLEIYCQG